MAFKIFLYLPTIKAYYQVSILTFYIYIRTGNFTDDRLESLRRKGEYLRMNQNQNLEKKRCVAISK
jgi:hypothetical protein